MEPPIQLACCWSLGPFDNRRTHGGDDLDSAVQSTELAFEQLFLQSFDDIFDQGVPPQKHHIRHQFSSQLHVSLFSRLLHHFGESFEIQFFLFITILPVRQREAPEFDRFPLQFECSSCQEARRVGCQLVCCTF